MRAEELQHLKAPSEKKIKHLKAPLQPPPFAGASAPSALFTPSLLPGLLCPEPRAASPPPTEVK